MVTIKLTQDEIDSVLSSSGLIANERHGEMVNKRNHDTNRSSNNLQWENGHLGEFAVYKLLRSNGINTSSPDYTLRTKQDRITKGYDVDLVVEGLNVEVKTDCFVKYSWAFGKDTEYAIRGKDIVAVVHREGKYEFQILGFYNLQYLFENGFFGKPLKLSLPKSCLYYNDCIRAKGIKNVPLSEHNDYFIWGLR